LNMEYQETIYEEPEPIIEIEEEPKEEILEETIIEKIETKEEEEETIMNNIEEMLNEASNLQTPEIFHNEVMLEKIEDKEVEIKENLVHTELNENDTEVLESIMSSTEESFYKYKIYIMRSEDTIESIAIKYNVTLDDLKEYNDLSNISIGDKIIIPFIQNEQD
ncbi:MAG: LysM peptidoglycan-binding domain-containing protein, partial [Bacilli bacterium]|nr:LysM peptidoglycan-binding domain-containing protein [Bacilli bacterium]